MGALVTDRSRHEKTPADRGADGDDLADARYATDQANGWQRDADTKAGLLSAALAVVTAGIAQHAAEVVTAPGHRGWLPVVVLSLLAVDLVVAVVSLAWVIIPRTPPPIAPSRFGLPTLASAEWRRPPATRADAAEEAWREAHIVACIARRKYAALRLTSVAVLGSLPLYLGLAIAAS